MIKPRSAVTVVFFALCAGAIAWGVFADARTTRLEALLGEIRHAEGGPPGEISYLGIRDVGGPDGSVQLKVWSSGGTQGTEFVGFRGGSRPSTSAKRPPRIPFFGGIPNFLRPGEGEWKRRIKDADLTVRNYDITLEGRETIAGRPADLIRLQSRHPGRPSYRIAADVENRFPLGFQVLQDGATVFESKFQSITFRPDFAGRIPEPTPPRANWIKVERREVPVSQLASEAGYGIWRPASLPGGFELRGAEIVRVRVDVPEGAREALKAFIPGGLLRLDLPVVHVNYTDGMAVLSVVECAADSELWKFLSKFVPGGAGPSDGKVVARKFADRRGAAYLLELEGTVVLVAGNVSADEIEKIIPTFERR